MALIARLNTRQPDFHTQLSQRLAYEDTHNHSVEQTVKTIIARVRAEGDAALLHYTQTLDQRPLQQIQDACIPPEALQQALNSLPSEQRQALEAAAERIRSYHQHQQQSSWDYQDAHGNRLGQKITPMDRVGLYVPGGKAAYPSSVLMCAIPAKVAGVPEVVMVSPAPGGQINPLVLAAAAIAGVDKVFTLGGAQAIAGLAYGTQTLPKVDKIVGPGNIYVATAKRAVFGAVDIDMIAGPSEVLILADGSAPADWLAMDLLAQAEHDELAQAILISPDAAYLDAVQTSLERLLPSLSRHSIAATALKDRGALIHCRDLTEAVALSNRIAPEHLELAVADPDALLPHIQHAGAIFMGAYSSESLGDYCAGPNHVLPTAGTARFSSPLGVYSFQKRSSIIYCNAQGAQHLGPIAATLAFGEALEAHGLAAQYRLNPKG